MRIRRQLMNWNVHILARAMLIAAVLPAVAGEGTAVHRRACNPDCLPPPIAALRKVHFALGAGCFTRATFG